LSIFYKRALDKKQKQKNITGLNLETKKNGTEIFYDFSKLLK